MTCPFFANRVTGIAGGIVGGRATYPWSKNPGILPGMARTDPLTLEQLAELARKSLDNALDLLDEADGLIAFGKFARGYAIAILAGEEFGKFMMCQGAVGNLPGDDAYWRHFWKRFTSHDRKAANFTSMVGHVVDDQETRRWFMMNIEKHVEADQIRKFAGLYVDVAPDGTVIAPNEAIDPESARGVAYVLGTFIRSHAEMWDSVDFHDLYREAQRGATQMVDALRTGNPDTIAAAWDATLGRPRRAPPREGGTPVAQEPSRPGLEHDKREG